MRDLPDWLKPLTDDDLIRMAAAPGGVNERFRVALELERRLNAQRCGGTA